MTGQVKERGLQKEITEVEKEEARLVKLSWKERSSGQGQGQDPEGQGQGEGEEEPAQGREAQEKERIRKERDNFWPKYVYSVRITLDAAIYTPMSSRRASIASDIVKAPEKMPEGDDAAGLTCDLSLTYVTTSAFWSPTMIFSSRPSARPQRFASTPS